MQESKLLVVIGATGNQGNAVLQHFAKTPELNVYKLRGLTRNIESAASKQLQALGIEMIKADLADEASLQAAFRGATHIFANTDSNVHIFQAIKDPQILPQGETPLSYARNIELSHGRNIAKAAAATADTLQRLVWSGLSSPTKWSNGKYTKVTMYDAKEDIADMLAATPGLEGKLNTLLVGYYATNAIGIPAVFAPQKSADGTYELALPMSGDVPVPFADLEADTGPWVNALIEAPAGTILVGSSEMLSWKQWLDIWAREVGVQAHFRRAPGSELGDKVPGIGNAMVEAFAFTEEYGFDGGNPRAIYPDNVSVIKISENVQGH